MSGIQEIQWGSLSVFSASDNHEWVAATSESDKNPQNGRIRNFRNESLGHFAGN